MGYWKYQARAMILPLKIGFLYCLFTVIKIAPFPVFMLKFWETHRDNFGKVSNGCRGLKMGKVCSKYSIKERYHWQS